MARYIDEECTACGACGTVCPVGAISMGASHMEIDTEVCIDCMACEGECAANAITEE